MGAGHRAGPGKIGSLGLILDQFYEDLEADLAHHYPGRRLAELWTGKMSYRELWVMCERLPMESLTFTAIRESMSEEDRDKAAQRVAGHGRWSRQDYLMASVIDAIHDNTYVLAKINGAKVEAPKPVDRPGLVKPGEPNAAGMSLMAEILALGGGIPERFVNQTGERPE